MRGSICRMLGLVALAACGGEVRVAQLAEYGEAGQLPGIKAELTRGAGVTLFVTESDGSRSELINEFGGQLKVDSVDGSVRLVGDDGSSVLVGESQGAELQLCSGDYSRVCSLAVARKFGDVPEAATVYSANLSFHSQLDASTGVDGAEKMDELNRLALPSPDQQDAGSCLYMASTGALEILFNKDPSKRDLTSDGTTDLSERYLMNAAARDDSKSWLTDAVLTFNQFGAVRNSDYRYTKGWLKESGGASVPASRGSEGAFYSTRYNWLDGLNASVEAKAIEVPTVRRNIIYKDPEANQWNTGIMNPTVIEKIKTHLRTKKTPVILIYNHYAYWHAAVIVGFDDSKVHGECPFAKSYIQQMRNNPRQLEYIQKVESAMAEHGCSTKGVFYVRDSIYRGDYRNIYDYDPTTTEDDAPYSKTLVEHEYEWALYLGNHAYTVEF